MARLIVEARNRGSTHILRREIIDVLPDVPPLGSESIGTKADLRVQAGDWRIINVVGTVEEWLWVRYPPPREDSDGLTRLAKRRWRLTPNQFGGRDPITLLNEPEDKYPGRERV